MKKNYILLTLLLIGQLISTAQTWTTTAPMDSVRDGLALVTLLDGNVLAIGGWEPTTGTNRFSAELYNPITNSWSAAGTMSATRYKAEAVLLNNGKVLVVGGYNKKCGCNLKTCELYDPVTKTFSLTGSMSIQRYAHTLTLLSNGKVLVVGGTDGVSSSFLASAEVYDPVTGLWTAATSMSQDREFHTATLLNDGKVLVTGGNNWNSFQVQTVEIYDPVSNLWAPGLDMFNTRDNHAAVKLASGEVLVSGGRYFEYSTTGPYVAHYSSVVDAEVYDPTADNWSPVNGPMMPGMSYHSMVALNNGNVLSVAGVDSSTSNLVNTTSVSQLFNTTAQTWSAMPMNFDGRFDFKIAKLNNGDVLVCGGNANDCERFNAPVGISTNMLDQGNYFVSYSPTDMSFVVKSTVNVKENSTVNVYDVTGRRVIEEVLPANNDRKLVSVEGLNKGIYIVTISGNNMITNSQKVVLY